MKEFTIEKNDADPAAGPLAGQNPAPPSRPLAQKYIRLKRVKVNGKGSPAGLPPAIGRPSAIIHQRRVL